MVKSIPLIQKDYYTGEVVGRYTSIREASVDNEVKEDAIRTAIKKNGGKLKIRKLWFIKENERVVGIE